MTLWGDRARRLLEQALDDFDDFDQIPTLSAAIAALRIDNGEMPEDELDGYPFPGEPVQGPECICPPDLVARGGFRGSCPAYHLLEVD